jgi:acyl carrier protein
MTKETIIDELRGFISREFLNGNDEGLDATTPLLEWGIIDSTSILLLVAFLKERMGVPFRTSELKPKDLETLGNIADLVMRAGNPA